MSAALYPTRLFWCGGRGIAKLDGREVRLAGPPHLPGLQVDGMDYAPHVVAMVMPQREGWREMTGAELEQCRALLIDLTMLGAKP